MKVETSQRLPLSNDWSGLGYRELTEKVAHTWRAKNPSSYLSRSALKQLTHDAKHFIAIGDYGKIRQILGDQSDTLTYANPTERAALRLVTASPKARARILFELGEGPA